MNENDISKAVAEGIASANKGESHNPLKHPAAGYVVGLIGFLAFTVFSNVTGTGGSNSAGLQKVQVRLATIEAQLDTLTSRSESRTRDRYTSEDASRDFARQKVRDEGQDDRIDKLERRVNAR